MFPRRGPPRASSVNAFSLTEKPPPISWADREWLGLCPAPMMLESGGTSILHHSTRQRFQLVQIAKCYKCKGLVKPDIVFFGESLPGRFFTHAEEDMPKCDLLIIMGTSLVVYPFAALQDLVGDDCPRLLINREQVGNLDFGEDNVRDALYEGDCDAGVEELARLLGWSDEFSELLITHA